MAEPQHEKLDDLTAGLAMRLPAVFLLANENGFVVRHEA